MEKSEVETTLLSLTPLAAERVRALLVERNVPDHALRVFVAGSGCSGLRYGMALEGAPNATDTTLEFGDVKVVIDPYSAEYLRGATVDYVELVTGAGFKIDNPNAPASSCGCGQSAGRDADSGCGGGCG